MQTFQNTTSTSLAVALGANISSAAGTPTSTMRAVRPKLEKTISNWISSSLKDKKHIESISKSLRWRWSPLFETEPVGGPKGQPPFINAVLVVDGPRLIDLEPSEEAATHLLEKFLALEKDFGRDRSKSSNHWGPRSLDLDLLAWGPLQIKSNKLTLPHPRLIERSFVVVPLAAALIKGIQPPRQISPAQNWLE